MKVCFKRFMNNSAVACHMKIHSDRKYYECPLCRLGFDQIHALKVRRGIRFRRYFKFLVVHCKSSHVKITLCHVNLSIVMMISNVINCLKVVVVV